MTERAPIEDDTELPAREVGDRGSAWEEPEHGNENAAEPELEEDVARPESLQ